MYRGIWAVTCGILMFCPGFSQAAFTPDEFDGTTLGSQWTFHDNSIGTAVTTYTVTDGHLRITAGEGDLYHPVDTHAYVEQDAPAGTDWEVITKIDNWDPTVAGEQRKFIRSGIQLWQDNNRWLAVCVLTNDLGTRIDIQSPWQAVAGSSTDPEYQGSQIVIGYGVHASLYMKIQKTNKGYRGYISTDGAGWLECMSVIRSPETPDGYFTNEKIRLFQAGGLVRTDGSPQNPTPVNFDYIRMNPLTPAPVGYQNDEFNATQLGPQWQLVEGMGPGNIAFSGSAVYLSGGIFSDLWGHIEQPMHIMQDAPTSGTYTVTIKCDTVDMASTPYELWNSYGIWLWHDASNWSLISIQRRGDPNARNGIEAAFKFNGEFLPWSVDLPVGTLCPSYLRLVKKAGVVSAQYSYDNVTYTTVNVPGTPPLGGTEFPLPDTNNQVRLFTKRASGSGTPVAGAIDWLRAEPVISSVTDWQLF